MIRTKALLTGMAAAIAFSAAADAADLPLSYERPVPRYVEMVSGWYVRGDVGYRFNHVDSFQAPHAITSAKYPDSAGFTFGGGYKYDWFRSDVTVDYASPVTARAASSSRFSQPQYTTKLDPLSILANAYLDLGTWWGFAPYVGAGAGVTYVRGHEYTDTSLLPPNYATSNGRTNFSWAAMAGVSYRIDARWMIDVGYRHLEMGDLPTTTGNLVVDQTRWKALSTDEFRLGFRFLLD
jgi:opacity protein-like surface antigen